MFAENKFMTNTCTHLNLGQLESVQTAIVLLKIKKHMFYL